MSATLSKPALQILAILFLFSGVDSRAQTLTISGKVQYYKLEKSGRIFYETGDGKFRANRYIMYDSMGNYTFKMSMKEIREKNIEHVRFALDSNEKTDQFACVHTIHPLAIVTAPEFSGHKSITLKSDLFIGLNCEMSTGTDAYSEGTERFVGSYTLRTGDTTRSIVLSEYYFSKSSISPSTPDHMNAEMGGWRYEPEKIRLTLYVRVQMNDAYGLMLEPQRQYFTFIVTTPNGQLQFKGKDGTLVKN